MLVPPNFSFREVKFGIVTFEKTKFYIINGSFLFLFFLCHPD